MSSSSRYIAVDVETSGLSVQRGGRVIEVGAVMHGWRPRFVRG